MPSINEIVLNRDCKATIIPAGDAATLPIGTKITITHRLGGNFTVTTHWGMFRIAGADADALGEAIPETIKTNPKENSALNGSQGLEPPSEASVWERLKTVFDPEIPVNIVDLGLVYSLDIHKLEEGGHGVHMAMTLTAPGCGMGPVIAEDAKKRILEIPGVSSAHVEIVWDPPWTQDMISEHGKMELGML